MKRWSVMLAIGAIVLAACGTPVGGGDASEDAPGQEQSLPTIAPGADEPEATEPANEPGDTPIPVEPNNGIGDGATGGELPVSLDGPYPKAVTDLSERLGIDASDITVVEARAVTWGDSSLGCPEPGKLYTQVLTDGWLIVLEAKGTTYEYHAGSGDPFLCMNPVSPSTDDPYDY